MVAVRRIQRASAVWLTAACVTGYCPTASFATAATGPDPGPEETARIEQIVVVAHKDERSARKIAANVTVVSKIDLENQIANSIGDILRYVPGIDHEAAGTRFGTEGISIRGIGGNRVAIVVDGVPLSDHFNVGSFSNATRDFIDAGLVHDIEVLHGPASALYGSSAIGGVVAIRTPDPLHLAGATGSGGELSASWQGQDDSVHARALFGAGTPKLGLMAGASWHQGHETDSAARSDAADRRQASRRTGLLKLVGDNRFGHSWRGEYIRQQSHTRSSLTSLLGQGRYRSTTALEGDDRYGIDLLIAAYEFGAADSWLDRGTIRVFHESARVEQATLDERAAARTPVSINRLFVFDQVISGAEANFWKQWRAGIATHRLGFGIEYRERETLEYRDGLATDLVSGEQTRTLLGEEFPLRDFPLSTTRELAGYLEDTLSVGDWTLVAALRAEQFRLSPRQDPMYLEDYPFADLVSIDDSQLSPKVAAIWHWSEKLDFYAQYSHGFRAPPYADANIGLEMPFFNYRAIPNPDLKSETSDGLDLGMRWAGVRSSARLSIFSTRYRNFIESRVRLGTDPVSGRILFQSQNLRATRIQGIEAGVEVSLGQAWLLEGSAYLARGENEGSGEALNSVGPAQGVLGLTWLSADERRRVRLQVTLTDEWSDLDQTGGDLFQPAGSAVVDLFVTQRIGAHATLRAGLLNLTDKTYWHWSAVRGLSPDDPLLPYLAQAGANASLSLNLTW